MLDSRGVAGAHDTAKALSGGQAKLLLAKVPAAARAALDRDLHAAAVSGVQWTFLASGVIGVVAGVIVLVMVRPARTSDEWDVAASAADPVSA